MPEIISTFEFWVTILTVFGAGRLTEAAFSRFINRKKINLENKTSSLRFMVDRMKVMEEEMERQKVEIKQLRSTMNKLEGEYKRVSDTLYQVTETVERHGGEDVIQRIREIPGVPTVTKND